MCETEGRQECAVLPKTAAQEVEQILLVPENLDLARVDVCEVHEPVLDDASEEVLADEELQRDAGELEEVEIGAQERAQRGHLRLGESLEGLIEAVEYDPRREFDFGEHLVQQA